MSCRHDVCRARWTPDGTPLNGARAADAGGPRDPQRPRYFLNGTRSLGDAPSLKQDKRWPDQIDSKLNSITIVPFTTRRKHRNSPPTIVQRDGMRGFREEQPTFYENARGRSERGTNRQEGARDTISQHPGK